MPRDLIPQQEAFATAYVLSAGNATQAAIQAGYSVVSARQTASRLMHMPSVQDAIRRVQGTMLRGRLATKALSVLEKVLDDETAPCGVRVEAAKTILDRAGLVAHRGPAELTANERPVSEWTLAELDAMAASLDQSLRTLQAEVIEAAD